MRISLVLPNAGLFGGIRVVVTYAELLAARGHEVTIIWYRPGRGRPGLRNLGSRILESLRIRESELPRFESEHVQHIYLPHSGPVTDGDVSEADVVVATWWETAAWVAQLAPSKGAKAYFVQDYGAEGQPLEELISTWRLPLHKITISRWLLDLVQQHCDGDAIELVPNAVDLERFTAPPRSKQRIAGEPRPAVGFVYSAAPQKGTDIILRAIHIARQSLPRLRVIAFGGTKPTEQLPLPDGVEYFEKASDGRVCELYALCDAWLFASRREGFGLPILEAMACRTPVIATPGGAAPELLADGGGIAVNHECPCEMAAAIQRVAAMSEHEWKTMSDAAYRIATRYTLEDATTRLESALRRAIDRPRENEVARDELPESHSTVKERLWQPIG